MKGRWLVSVVLMSLYLFFIPCGQCQSWWNDSWNKRKPVVISNATSSNLSDFPVYIRVSSEPEMQSDYDDLRFILGASELDYEIEFYDTARADVWVRIPLLSSAGETVYIYYDNPAASNGENPAGVWDAHYMGVWHLNESPGNGGLHLDSTSHGNNGVFHDGDGNSNTSASGIVGGSDDLGGNDDYINCGNDVSLNLTTYMTLEVWAITTDNGYFIARTTSDAANRQYNFANYPSSSNSISFWYPPGTSNRVYWSNEALSDSNWHYVVLTVDDTTAELFKDGGSLGTRSLAHAITPYDTETWMGARPNGSGGAGFPLEGTIDEVRISDIPRDADWIRETYELIYNQNTMVTEGAPENRPTPTPTFTPSPTATPSFTPSPTATPTVTPTPTFDPGAIYVPTDYATIQAAIDAASPGGKVYVLSGTYSGVGNKNLDYHGKPITVASLGGASSCIIDCEGNGRGFYFHSGEDDQAVVNGFTIINGEISSSQGGGILCWNTSPLIKNCVISQCNAASGGGIACSNGASPLIYRCSILQNSTGGDGAGIQISDSSNVHIVSSMVVNNTGAWYGGGIACEPSTQVSIENCIITGNDAQYGGGIYVQSSTVAIRHCTITGNTAATEGGGLLANGSDPSVIDTILWNDTPEEIAGSGAPSVTYCDVQMTSGTYPGTGNINSDPLFASGPEGVYYLSQLSSGQPVNSPCMDAGSAAADMLFLNTPAGLLPLGYLTTRTDEVIDSSIVDMGVHYYPSAFVTPTPTPTPTSTVTPTATVTPQPLPSTSTWSMFAAMIIIGGLFLLIPARRRF